MRDMIRMYMSQDNCVNVAELEIVIFQKGPQPFDGAAWVYYYEFLRGDDYRSIAEWKSAANNNVNSIANSNRSHLDLTSFRGCESDMCFLHINSSNELDIHPIVVLTLTSAAARTA